jgi:hypothetical protein
LRSRASLEFSQEPTKGLFRLAIAVRGSRVDPVDSAIDGSAQDGAPGIVVGMQKYAADVAATQDDLRNI